MPLFCVVRSDICDILLAVCYVYYLYLQHARYVYTDKGDTWEAHT